MRLPRVAVVAVFLYVANWLAEVGARNAAHGEHGDFVVEVNKTLHNHASGSGTSAFLRYVPSLLGLRGGFNDALAVARRAHYGLNDAWCADFADCGFEFLES